MVYNKAPQPSPGKHGGKDKEGLVIERSNDPLQLLASILTATGTLAAQWGEEILLHLRVAALWVRIGKKDKGVDYITNLATLHAIDTFHLGAPGVKFRIDLMRFFLTRIGVDEASIRIAEMAERARNTTPIIGWLQKTKFISKMLPGMDIEANLLTPEEEQEVREIIQPSMSWLESVYLTPIPASCREALAVQISGISEYGDPTEIEQRLYAIFDQCRRWHERQSDTPIWVHDLDDIGPRTAYLAITIERPQIITTYIERCIDALNERPLALMPNIATAIGGLVYMAKALRRDDLLHRALDTLPRLPEHEQCIAALTLVEVLVERGGTASHRV
jgi:hypothetical protein